MAGGGFSKMMDPIQCISHFDKTKPKRTDVLRNNLVWIQWGSPNLFGEKDHEGYWQNQCYRSCCSVTQCPTLCHPIDCSTPGFPVFPCLLEFAQMHAHWVKDAIQPSHPLSPLSPALNLSQHQGLFWRVGSSNQVAKVLESLPLREEMQGKWVEVNGYSKSPSSKVKWVGSHTHPT